MLLSFAMKLEDAGRWLRNTFVRNPTPSKRTIEKLQACDMVAFCVRKSTYDRCTVLFQQLTEHSIRHVEDWDIAKLSLDLRERLQECTEEATLPVLAILEATETIRRFDIWDALKDVGLAHPDCRQSVLYTPNVSHTYRLKDDYKMPEESGHQELMDRLDQEGIHTINRQLMRPADILQAAVLHHLG